MSDWAFFVLFYCTIYSEYKFIENKFKKVLDKSMQCDYIEYIINESKFNKLNLDQIIISNN